MTYGEKIIELRKRNNITQQQLGDELNVSAQAVSKWEHNLSEPDLATIKKICLYFKISTDEFFELNDLIDNTSTQNEEPQIDENAITKIMPAEFLGVCSNCGIAINNDNLGRKEPKILCKKCLQLLIDKRKKKQEEEQNKENEKKQRDLDSLKHDKNKSIGYGLLGAIVVTIINILIVVVGSKNGIFDKDFTIGYSIFTVYFFYAIYALIADFIIACGFSSEVFGFFLRAPIRFPGIIFSLDFGGIIFLIAVKILFAIIGFIVGVALFFVGVVLGSLVAAFTFPFNMAKLNNQIKSFK